MTDRMSILELTAAIVASYVEANSLPADELPGVIRAVGAALGGREPPPEPAVARPSAASIRKSITLDHLVSFEDGKPYRMLKQHLAQHGLTPASYRAKWGLPADYPMTAPSYSALRADLARHIGLGRNDRADGRAAEGVDGDRAEADGRSRTSSSAG
jgi:predicted transcriptional regulator